MGAAMGQDRVNEVVHPQIRWHLKEEHVWDWQMCKKVKSFI